MFNANYSYLKPPSKYVKTRSGTPLHQNGQRVVFGGPHTNLTNLEAEAVNRLSEYLKHKNQNKEYESSLLLRYCYLGNLRTSDSLERFKFYEDWWAIPAISKDKERGILQSGVFYSYGRDYECCPNIYFHPSKTNLSHFSFEDYFASLRTLLSPIEEKMLVPGVIEKWNIIVDLRTFNDKSFQSNESIIINNFFKICNAYPYRAKKIFMVHHGSSQGLFSKFGLGNSSTSLANEVVKQLSLEPICLKIEDLHELDQHIPREEREKMYGGTLENLLEYWPIPSTNRLMEVNSRFIDGSEDSIDYKSIMNEDNASFFAEHNEKAPLCNFKQCSIQ